MLENRFRNAHRRFVSAVAVTAVVAVPGVAIAAPTTFTLGGTAQLVDAGQIVPPPDLSGVLSGRYDDGACVSVPYPATVVGMDYSIALGADRLVADIQSMPGEKRALGISQGAIAIAEAKRRLEALPAEQRPAPDTLTFVAIADPTRPGHGVLAQMGYQTADTPYDTTYVTREYDGFADLPDRFNVMATINAAAGIVYVHPYYGELPADIPAENITKTINSAGGTVTDVLIPNAHLPMLQPLRDLGFNVDGLEVALKPMVDAGYSRNDVKPAPPKAVAAPIEKRAAKPVNNPHRNVQASDAAHETDDDQPSKTKDVGEDKKSKGSTPAEVPQADKPADDPADKAKGDSGSTGGDE